MIRTESEYKQTVEQLAGFVSRLQEKTHELREMKLTDEQIERATEADKVFYAQLDEEVKCYEHLCQGNAKELNKFAELRDMGKLLIALRIFRGLKQSDLAARLGVDPSQISRDERNEYHGITLQRVSKIIDALDVRLKCQYEPNLRETPREVEIA